MFNAAQYPIPLRKPNQVTHQAEYQSLDVNMLHVLSQSVVFSCPFPVFRWSKCGQAADYDRLDPAKRQQSGPTKKATQRPATSPNSGLRIYKQSICTARSKGVLPQQTQAAQQTDKWTNPIHQYSPVPPTSASSVSETVICLAQSSKLTKDDKGLMTCHQALENVST